MSKQDEKQKVVFSLKETSRELQALVEKHRKNNENINVENYGLAKGQSVARHVRKDPRTGKSFVAGRGGSGSAETVMAEHKTVAPNIAALTTQPDPNGISVNVEAAIPEDSIHNPATLEQIIRNLHNATYEKIQQMANDLFTQPRSRSRGVLAELMLKELLLRGPGGKSDAENEKESMETDLKEKQDKAEEIQAKQKEKETKQKEKEKNVNANNK